MTKEKNKKTIKKDNKKEEKKPEEVFGDLPFTCDCSSCPRKCN